MDLKELSRCRPFRVGHRWCVLREKEAEMYHWIEECNESTAVLDATALGCLALQCCRTTRRPLRSCCRGLLHRFCFVECLRASTGTPSGGQSIGTTMLIEACDWRASVSEETKGGAGRNVVNPRTEMGKRGSESTGRPQVLRIVRGSQCTQCCTRHSCGVDVPYCGVIYLA